MTAMRVIAYFHPSEDPFAIRNSLRLKGFQRVGMRDGSLWRSTDLPESDWDAVHAPLFPGIVRAYEAAGCAVADVVPGSLKPVDPPHEVTLPTGKVWAILNPGKFLADEIAAYPIPDGAVTIGVNEAARRVSVDWQLCNDGFTDARFHGVMGNPGRMTRRRFAATIHTGAWFALDDIGITEGIYSTTCALRVAASAAPTAIRLYGHDLTTGSGLDGMTDHWDDGRISTAKAEIDGEMRRIRALRIPVNHYHMRDGKPVVDSGVVIADNSPQRRRRGKHGTA